MRLVTLLTVALNSLNALLLFSVSAVAIWLWWLEAVTAGAIAFAIGLILRMQGMSHWIMWELASLFEQIGVVHDGLETIARERTVVDTPDPRTLSGAARRGPLDRIRFNYGKNRDDEGWAGLSTTCP